MIYILRNKNIKVHATSAWRAANRQRLHDEGWKTIGYVFNGKERLLK